MPPQLLLYLALAPEEKISYKLGGPAADARFEAGMAGYEARPFRSCGVVTSEPYEVSDDADAVQMLTRSTQARSQNPRPPPSLFFGFESRAHTLACCRLASTTS